MAGISNVTTEELIEDENDDFQGNFVGVFPSDRVTPFLNILNIYPKKQLFLFDSYGFLGFTVFIEQDDGDIINKSYTTQRSLLKKIT